MSKPGTALEGELTLVAEDSPNSGPVIFTIGHSIHSAEKLVGLLKSNAIKVLVDIRSEPFSRKVPHFNKDKLEKKIRESGLRYLFLGRELGGRPKKRQFYDPEGFVLYSRIAESPDFKSGIERILKGIRTYRVAIMCSEENPMNCHRRLLVGRVLSNWGVNIIHIRGDGSIQPEGVDSQDRHRGDNGQTKRSLSGSEEAGRV